MVRDSCRGGFIKLSSRRRRNTPGSSGQGPTGTAGGLPSQNPVPMPAIRARAVAANKRRQVCCGPRCEEAVSAATSGLAVAERAAAASSEASRARRSAASAAFCSASRRDTVAGSASFSAASGYAPEAFLSRATRFHGSASAAARCSASIRARLHLRQTRHRRPLPAFAGASLPLRSMASWRRLRSAYIKSVNSLLKPVLPVAGRDSSVRGRQASPDPARAEGRIA